METVLLALIITVYRLSILIIACLMSYKLHDARWMWLLLMELGSFTLSRQPKSDKEVQEDILRDMEEDDLR